MEAVASPAARREGRRADCANAKVFCDCRVVVRCGKTGLNAPEYRARNKCLIKCRPCSSYLCPTMFFRNSVPP